MEMTTNYVNVHDSDPREGDITYYGVIKDIIELSFNDGFRKIVLFEYDWTANNKNKTDKYGFTLVDFTKPNKKLVPSFYHLCYCKHSLCWIYAICLEWCPLSQNHEMPSI